MSERYCKKDVLSWTYIFAVICPARQRISKSSVSKSGALAPKGCFWRPWRRLNFEVALFFWWFLLLFLSIIGFFSNKGRNEKFYKNFVHKNAIKIFEGFKFVALLTKFLVLFTKKFSGAFFGAFWPKKGASWFKTFRHTVSNAKDLFWRISTIDFDLQKERTTLAKMATLTAMMLKNLLAIWPS